jgi:hypothetical protein
MEQKSRIKLTKEQAAVLNDLYSNNETKIEQSVKHLREKGGIHGIEPLINVYFNTQYPNIRKIIGNLFSDTKENKVTEIITENIVKYKNSEFFGEFLSTLWQASLKFDNIKLFAEIFIDSDDKTAFECLTIIEQNAEHSSDEEKAYCISLLKDNINKLVGFKKDLAVNLLDILK